MDNPEKRATLGTRHKDKQNNKTKHRKLIRRVAQNLQNNPGVNPGTNNNIQLMTFNEVDTRIY